MIGMEENPFAPLAPLPNSEQNLASGKMKPGWGSMATKQGDPKTPFPIKWEKFPSPTVKWEIIS